LKERKRITKATDHKKQVWKGQKLAKRLSGSVGGAVVATTKVTAVRP